MQKNLGFHLFIIPDIRLGHCRLERYALFVGEFKFAHLGTADLSALYSGSTLTWTLRNARVSRMPASEFMLVIVYSTPCTSSALARLPSAEKVTWRTRLVSLVYVKYPAPQYV